MTSFFRDVDIGLSGIRPGGGLSGGSFSPREGGRGELGLPIRPDSFPGGERLLEKVSPVSGWGGFRSS